MPIDGSRFVTKGPSGRFGVTVWLATAPLTKSFIVPEASSSVPATCDHWFKSRGEVRVVGIPFGSVIWNPTMLLFCIVSEYGSKPGRLSPRQTISYPEPVGFTHASRESEFVRAKSE